VTSLPRPGKAARARLAIAISLGVISILGGLLLAAADVIRGTATWPHHSPVSAAPLFLVAAAIAAVSIGRPADGRHGLLRLVAVLAFTAWGTAQLAPDPAAASALSCSLSSTAAPRWSPRREPSWPDARKLLRQPRYRTIERTRGASPLPGGKT
jgi:hypothetical protein